MIDINTIPLVVKKSSETDSECLRRYGHNPDGEEGWIFLVKELNGVIRVISRSRQPRPGMPLIIGDGLCPEAAAFYDVRDALEGYGNVVLNAHLASNMGQIIRAGSVIYNLEHLVPGGNPMVNFRRYINFLDTLKTGMYTVWDYQRGNVDYLRTLGIEVRHVPFGYHSCFERVTPTEQDIDVLFFGTPTPRREKVLNAIARAGIRHKFVFDYIYGDERDKLIARAKIIVNVSRLDNHPLEVVRLNYLLANKCFVISERGSDDVENALYEGALVFSDYADIASKCIEYLTKDREAIASRGREIIRARPMKVT